MLIIFAFENNFTRLEISILSDREDIQIIKIAWQGLNSNYFENRLIFQFNLFCGRACYFSRIIISLMVDVVSNFCTSTKGRQVTIKKNVERAHDCTLLKVVS